RLGIGRPDDGVAADRHGGRLPETGGAERVADLGRHAARARHHADRSLLEGPAHVHGGTAEATHLRLVGRQDAEAVRTDDARAAELRQLDHLRHLAARNALGDDDDALDARPDGLEHGVAREARRHGDDGAVHGHLRRDVADAVVDRNAVDVATGPPWRDPADDLRAVVEAFAGEVHRLAPGDALDDDRGVL